MMLVCAAEQTNQFETLHPTFQCTYNERKALRSLKHDFISQQPCSMVKSIKLAFVSVCVPAYVVYENTNVYNDTSCVLVNQIALKTY